ncbi:mRNA export protein mlo3 [Paramyrothecium foliicola]|nr:mRNA export protein mlo3 [Paramyrothecium foliicola]
MSGKLDQSLDEITTAQRRSTRQRRSTQRRSTGRPAPAAPIGGIQKATKPARGAAAKPALAKAAAANSDSKVIVSNLPKDVTEKQIKEYFVQSVGPIKRVELAYGPNSQSRGIASVIFNKPDGASKAFQKLNGLLVDNRPIKIEIVVGAAQADKVIPPPAKTLAERTSQPKAQPKSAASNKQTAKATKGATAKGAATTGKGRRGGRSARPTKKTAEELDSDMADYFGGGSTNENSANAAAPAPAAGTAGDAAMEDEIMV